MVAPPPPSWGPTCGQSGYITVAFSGVPDTEHGDKIRNGYVTLAILGATCGQSGYITRTVLGVPNAQRGHKIRNGHLIALSVGTPTWQG